MSTTLYKFAQSFVNGRLSAGKFADSFQELWKIERNDGLFNEDEDRLSEALSTIFCLADLYNPDNDREEYELDEDLLRERVAEKLQIE
jgi:self-protective colicin-like immunity protein